MLLHAVLRRLCALLLVLSISAGPVLGGGCVRKVHQPEASVESVQGVKRKMVALTLLVVAAGAGGAGLAENGRRIEAERELIELTTQLSGVQSRLDATQVALEQSKGSSSKPIEPVAPTVESPVESPAETPLAGGSQSEEPFVLQGKVLHEDDLSQLVADDPSSPNVIENLVEQGGLFVNNGKLLVLADGAAFEVKDVRSVPGMPDDVKLVTANGVTRLTTNGGDGSEFRYVPAGEIGGSSGLEGVSAEAGAVADKAALAEQVSVRLREIEQTGEEWIPFGLQETLPDGRLVQHRVRIFRLDDAEGDLHGKAMVEVSEVDASDSAVLSTYVFPAAILVETLHGRVLSEQLTWQAFSVFREAGAPASKAAVSVESQGGEDGPAVPSEDQRDDEGAEQASDELNQKKQDLLAQKTSLESSIKHQEEVVAEAQRHLRISWAVGVLSAVAGGFQAFGGKGKVSNKR